MIPAHNVAILLSEAVQSVLFLPSTDALRFVQGQIDNLCPGDIRVEIKDNTVLDLAPLTGQGKKILTEMLTCSDTPPCAEGRCDFADSSHCIWCGSARITP